MTDEEIDDRVEQWHEGEGKGWTLREYLGMTRQQYSRWVLRGINPDSNPTSRNWREGHYIGRSGGKAVRRFIPMLPNPSASVARACHRGQLARQDARRRGVVLHVTHMADQQGAS
jgi:hypothetical protein